MPSAMPRRGQPRRPPHRRGRARSPVPAAPIRARSSVATRSSNAVFCSVSAGSSAKRPFFIACASSASRRRKSSTQEVSACRWGSIVFIGWRSVVLLRVEQVAHAVQQAIGDALGVDLVAAGADVLANRRDARGIEVAARRGGQRTDLRGHPHPVGGGFGGACAGRWRGGRAARGRADEGRRLRRGWIDFQDGSSRGLAHISAV